MPWDPPHTVPLSDTQALTGKCLYRYKFGPVPPEGYTHVYGSEAELLTQCMAPRNGLSFTCTERMRGGKGLEAIPISTVSLSIPGTEVVLIDDVRTTGATLDKASRMCMALGARRVIAGVVAMRASDD